MKRVSVGLALCVLLVTLATFRQREPLELPREERLAYGQQQQTAPRPTREPAGRGEEKHSSAKPASVGAKSALSSETALAKDLRALDIATRERVFAAIAQREIPEQDYQSLRVTASGLLYYVCRIPKLNEIRSGEANKAQPMAASVATTDTGSKTSRGAVPVSKLPVYHSRPGAKNVLYLNFSGATLKKTGWNEISGVKTLTAQVFSLDTDTQNFNDTEQVVMRSVWERVAEDFSPFDIDVTTEAPKKITKRTAQVLITSSVMKDGATMPFSDDAAGLAFLDTFGESGAPAYYTPALVFHDQVASQAAYITEAVSHESGHLFGLSHDGTINEEYYEGHGAGETSWAPIMGVGYDRNRTQWSQGEYYEANNFQDDLAIIAAHTGWAKDEAGNDLSSANIKAAQDNGEMSVSGVLSTEDDFDIYAFSAQEGTIRFDANVFHPTSGGIGNNADLRIELLDRNGKILKKAAPERGPDASLSHVADKAGMYFLRVSASGIGSPQYFLPSGYTPYGSVGQYTLSANFAPTLPAIVGRDTISVGVLNELSYKLKLTNRAKNISVSGLPKWLKYNAKTGTFTGRPTATGTFVVTVRATNWMGTVELPLTFKVVDAPPLIAAQSKGLLRAKKGATLKLSVSAKSANGAISYQWKRNGVPISGAKSKTLKLSKAKLTDSGFYSVDMRNKIGTTTSALMYVRVMPKRTQAVLWDRNAKFLKGLESYSDVADIAIHFNQGVAVRAKGSLVFFRENKQATQRPEKMPTSVAKVVAHEGRFAAIKTDGTVTFWHLPNTGEWPTPPSLKRVVDVALGASHGLALHENGKVTAWGIAGSKAAKVPKKAKNVRAITATRNASFALLSTGKVIGWGDGYGAPLVPSGLKNVVKLAASDGTVFALRSNGTIRCWTVGYTSSTQRIEKLKKVTELAAGPSYVVGRTTNGELVNASFDDPGPKSPKGITDVVALYTDGLGVQVALRDASGDTKPVIKKQPAPVATIEGKKVTLSVTASGSPRLTYQWRHLGKAISGATSSSLVLDPVKSTSAGDYDVVVTNYLGKTTSKKAKLTVAPLPKVKNLSSSRLVLKPGDALTLQVQASGTGALSYQWYSRGVAIVGAKSETLTIPGLTSDQAGAYWVAVTDSNGTKHSTPFFVLVPPAETQVVAWNFNPLEAGFALPTIKGRVVQVATGSHRAIALKQDGTLVSWGDAETFAKPPSGLTNVVAVAAAADAYIALLSDGTVRQWGVATNGYGKLPAAPADLSDVVAIATGGDHFLALRSNGTVIAWGDKSYGKTTVPSGLKSVVAIAANREGSYALKSDGSVVGWGNSGISPWLPKVRKIAAGSSVAVAVHRNGKVTDVSGSAWEYGNLEDVEKIAVCGYSWMALEGDGELHTSGDISVPSHANSPYDFALTNDYAVVVRDATLDLRPAITTQPVNQTATEGGSATFTVGAEGGTATLSYQWRKDGVNIPGANGSSLDLSEISPSSAGNYSVVVSNRLGSVTSNVGKLTVTPLAVISKISAPRQLLASGSTTILSVEATGTGALSYQWFHNGGPLAGQTGTSATVSKAGHYWVEITDDVGTKRSPLIFVLESYGATEVKSWGSNGLAGGAVPKSLPALIAVAGGRDYSLGLTKEGKVILWSWSLWDSVPTNIPTAALTDVVAIAAGDNFALALRADGRVVAWGKTGYSVDKVPADLRDVVAISAGGYHALALTRSGRVYAWGANYAGQTTVPDWALSNVKGVAAGSYFSVVLTTSGEPRFLNNKSIIAQQTPETLPPFTQLVAGNDVVLGLTEAGKVIAWGDWGVEAVNVPSSLSGVKQIAVRADHAVALKTNGTVVVWGNKSYQQDKVPTKLTSVVQVAAGDSHVVALRKAE